MQHQDAPGEHRTKPVKGRKVWRTIRDRLSVAWIGAPAAFGTALPDAAGFEIRSTECDNI